MSLQTTEGYVNTFIQGHPLCQLLDQTGSCTSIHVHLTPPTELFLFWPEERINLLLPMRYGIQTADFPPPSSLHQIAHPRPSE